MKSTTSVLNEPKMNIVAYVASKPPKDGLKSYV